MQTRRDMDLIRKILLKLEQKNTPKPWTSVSVQGYDNDTVKYHIVLLAQAGFIDFEASRSTSNPNRIIDVNEVFWLTWDGHEFLDLARNETIWRKVAGKFASEGVGLALEILKPAMRAEIQNTLGL